MSINSLFSIIIFVLTYFHILVPSESFAAKADLTKAIKAAHNKNYEEAIAILKTEIARDSSDCRVYIKLADFFHLGKTKQNGVDFFKQAAKQNPDDPNNYAGLAIIYDYQKDANQVFLNSRKALEKGASDYYILELFINAGVALNKSAALTATLKAFQKSEAQRNLYDLGYTLWRLKIKNYKRARTTIRAFLEKNNQHGYGQKLYGDIERLTKNNNKAITNYLRAEKSLAKFDEKLKCELYALLGSTYFNIGMQDSAEFYHSLSVQFSKQTLQVSQFVENVKNLASFYREVNDFTGLISTMSDNRDMFVQNVDDASAGLDFVYELADAYNNSGDVLRAFEVFSEALNMAKKLKKIDVQAKIFYAIGGYYLRLGLIENALDSFEKCTNAAQIVKITELEYKSILEIAKIYEQQGNRNVTKKSFSKVLRYAQRRGQLELIEECYLRLALLYLQQPTDIRSVRYYLNMADAMARQTFQLHFAANHRWVQGLVALYEDDVETAETYFLHSIKIGEESGSYLSRLAGKAGLINVYRHTKFSDVACSYADSALTFLKNYYSFCFSEYSADFFDLKKDLIMPALMAYSSVGDLEKIYDTIELYKSIIHYRDLSQIKYKLNDQTAVTIQKEYDKRSAEIYGKWRELWTISRNGGEYLETAIRIKNEIQTIHSIQQDFLNDVLERNTEYYPFFKPAPKPLAELQEELRDKNSTFVHYFIGDAATFIIIVDGDDINCQRVNVNRTYLENHIFQISPIFSTERNNFSILSDSGISQFNLVKAGELYKFLVKPIEHLLDPTKTLIISKDGALNRIPFEALVLNSDQLIDELDFLNANYLVEKYAIAYLPSAYFMTSPKKRSHDNEKLFGLFAATEGLNDEMRSNGRSKRNNQVNKAQGFQKFIEPFGEGKSTLYLNKFANRKNFIEQGQQFQFLQVSLPAFLSEQFPFLSRFSFSNQQNDYFSAYELFSNPLNSDVFVLTNAEIELTTAGYHLATNGFFHGLTFAGVPTFVTSLWPKQQSNFDAVPDVLSQFESNLYIGLNKAKALQQAKIDYLNMNRVNPIFWASVVLYGDTGAVNIKEVRTSWVIWFSTLAVLTLCLFLAIQLIKVFRER